MDTLYLQKISDEVYFSKKYANHISNSRLGLINPEQGGDPKKFFQKNMGLVLKRRDNAPIVKYIYGGMVDKLLNTDDQQKGKREGLAFVKKSLNDMINGKFKINYFTIFKNNRSSSSTFYRRLK